MGNLEADAYVADLVVFGAFGRHFLNLEKGARDLENGAPGPISLKLN
jgi:hypothetical protein